MFPDAIKALSSCAEENIFRAAVKLVTDEETALGDDRLWEKVVMVEGPVDPASINVGWLYCKTLFVKPKEWAGQRATVSVDVYLCAALDSEKSQIDSDLLGGRIFNHYRSLFNTNLKLQDGMGNDLNFHVLDWDATWERMPRGSGVRILDMKFKFQVDIDPRDGSIAFQTG